jgi:hypothetical protein
MDEFEPLELPMVDGGDVERVHGRSEANSHGRQCLEWLVRDAVDGAGNAGLDRPEIEAGSIVEVGSWAGGSVLEMVEALALYKDVRIYCVDTWEGSPKDVTGAIAKTLTPKRVFSTFCKNVGPLLHRVIFPCVGRSLTWAAVWPHPVAMVYIDADHEYEAVKADIAAWWPHVLPGGILAGHDYHLFPGVKQAVDEWWSANGLECFTEGEVWYVQKPGEREEKAELVETCQESLEDSE